MKAGFSARWIRDTQVQATGALYAFPTIASYLAAASGANPFAYVLYGQTLGNPSLGYNSLFNGFFVQDHWKPARNLTIIYGLRYDIYKMPDANKGSPFPFSQRPIFSNSARVYPGFANILSAESVGNSEYHGMNVSLQGRFAHGYELFGTYTWSHAIDDAPEQNNIDSGNTVTLSDPSNRRRDRSNSLTDRRQVLNVTGVFAPPVPREQHTCSVFAESKPVLHRHGCDERRRFQHRQQSDPEWRQLRIRRESASTVCGQEHRPRASGLRTERPLFSAVSIE